MKKVRFSSDIDTVELETRSTLLDALLARRVAVKMFCGGRGICATCHVHVTRNPECLTPQTDRERLTVSLLTGARPDSRLACQSHVIGEGVEVSLPEGMYVESFADLERLIGKRTPVPILHPLTGATLIERNKIIVRSMIMQLKDVDFDVASVRLGRT
jgi:ferredoxin